MLVGRSGAHQSADLRVLLRQSRAEDDTSEVSLHGELARRDPIRRILPPMPARAAPLADRARVLAAAAVVGAALALSAPASAKPTIASGGSIELPVGASTGVRGDRIGRTFGPALRFDLSVLFPLGARVALAPGVFGSLGAPGAAFADACDALCATTSGGAFVDAELRARPGLGPWARLGVGASVLAGTDVLREHPSSVVALSLDPLRASLGFDVAGRRVAWGPFAAATLGTLTAADVDLRGRDMFGPSAIHDRALHVRLALGVRIVVSP